MARQFAFLLTDEEKQFLKDTVRKSIKTRLEGQDAAVPEPPTSRLKEPMGAFVTLNLDGRLRGCIGNLQAKDELTTTVWNMARSAAFKDPRFPELTPEEFERLEIEISIIGPITECRDKLSIEVGRHGLIVQRGSNSGLLLPQVPLEWGWDRETFLHQTCRKAGLEPDVLNKTGTNVFWFEAEVF